MLLTYVTEPPRGSPRVIADTSTRSPTRTLPTSPSNTASRTHSDPASAIMNAVWLGSTACPRCSCTPTTAPAIGLVKVITPSEPRCEPASACTR